MKEENREKEIVTKAYIKSGISKKGKTYYYIEIDLTDKTNKMVMLESAESELIENKYFNK